MVFRSENFKFHRQELERASDQKDGCHQKHFVNVSRLWTLLSGVLLTGLASLVMDPELSKASKHSLSLSPPPSLPPSLLPPPPSPSRSLSLSLSFSVSLCLSLLRVYFWKFGQRAELELTAATVLLISQSSTASSTDEPSSNDNAYSVASSLPEGRYKSSTELQPRPAQLKTTTQTNLQCMSPCGLLARTRRRPPRCHLQVRGITIESVLLC